MMGKETSEDIAKSDNYGNNIAGFFYEVNIYGTNFMFYRHHDWSPQRKKL